MRLSKKLFLLFFISFPSFAQSFDFSQEMSLPYTIVFGNGIANSRDDAQKSLSILKNMIGIKYKECVINYQVAYNPTSGPGIGTLNDVIEASKQKMGEINSLWTLTWQVIFGVVDAAEPNQSWVQTVSDIWHEYNVKILHGSLSNIYGNSNYYDDTVTNHVNLYRNLIIDGDNPQKVLLIAHSQGNLYGNLALENLEREFMKMNRGRYWDGYTKRMRMIGVGSAANYVYKEGSYLTSNYDQVINSVRKIYPTVLPANINLPAIARSKTIDENGKEVYITDVTGHGFATVYTNPQYSGREQLAKKITDQLESLGRDAFKYGGAQFFATYYNLSGNTVIRYADENFNPKTEVIYANTDKALEQFLYPKIFDPKSEIYIGFPKKHAKIQVLKSKILKDEDKNEYIEYLNLFVTAAYY